MRSHLSPQGLLSVVAKHRNRLKRKQRGACVIIEIVSIDPKTIPEPIAYQILTGAMIKNCFDMIRPVIK